MVNDVYAHFEVPKFPAVPLQDFRGTVLGVIVAYQDAVTFGGLNEYAIERLCEILCTIPYGNCDCYRSGVHANAKPSPLTT